MTERGKWRPEKGRGVGNVFFWMEDTVGEVTFAHKHTPTHTRSQTYEQKLTVVTGGIKALYIRKLANSFGSTLPGPRTMKFLFFFLFSNWRLQPGPVTHSCTHRFGGGDR